MKKIAKIILIILSILVVVIGALVYWQYDNITAAINGMRYSSDELASQLEVKRDDLKTQVDKYTSLPVNDLSAEDEEKLLKGELSIDEVLEKYNLPQEDTKESNEQNTVKSTVENTDNSVGVGDKTVNTAKNTESSKPIETGQASSDDAKKIDEAISTGVSKMYALKAKYVSKIGEVQRAVIEEYVKLPVESQTEASKKSIATRNLIKIATMEEQCDKEVTVILATLKTELTNLKGDVEIVDILKESYENEKTVKKSYYLSLYK